MTMRINLSLKNRYIGLVKDLKKKETSVRRKC